MKKLKMFLAPLFVLTLALMLLTGCAADTPAPAPEAPAPAPEAPAAEAPAAEEPAQEPEAPATDDGEVSNLEASLALMEASVNVMSTDGQPLMPPLTVGQAPPRPDDPSALDDYDLLRWFDMEFAGLEPHEKVNIPPSPGDGSIGKHVIVIVHGDHPWTTAYENGARKAAEALGMTIDVWSPNWDVAMQNQLIEQAIIANPDAIGIIPLSAEGAVMQFRTVNEAGIPVFGTNTLPTSEAMPYMVTWTGPDDWGQMRMMARALAERMGNEGGIAYVTHNPGTSPYFARMWGPRTELRSIAPNIRTLDFQSPGFDAPATRQVVADWITRFGDEINAIFLADDDPQAIGTVDALRAAGREDIIVVAAGNSRQGMTLVQEGAIYVVNYQTAEGDGAAVVRSMADFFNGVQLPAVAYLAQDLIFQADVDNFLPPQW